MTRRRSSYQSLTTGLVETIASDADRLGWAIKGQVVKQGNVFSRSYPLELPVPPLRTFQQTVCDATKATQTGQAQNGLQNASDLLQISFDIVNSCPVEYLLSVCLGVVKHRTSVWFETLMRHTI